MSHFHAKLQAHLAARAPSWADDAATARYADDAGDARFLVVVPRALTAADVVDAHLAAQRAGARPALAFDGAATDVARRTARRLGVELVDVATLPEPVVAAPAEVAPADAEPIAAEPVPLAIEVALADAPATIEVPFTIETPVVAEAPEPVLALPAPAEIVALLPAHVEPEAPVVDAPETVDALVVELLGAFETAILPEFVDAPALVEPAMPELAVEAPAFPKIALEAAVELAIETPALPQAPTVPEPAPVVAEPALPWTPAPLVETPFVAQVAAADLAAMPWNAPPTVVAPADDHVELLPSGRRAREDHPTLLPQWGLPWTPANGAAPVPVTEALSKADPALWNQAKRVDALRESLAKTGAPSFGAVKPAASGWLSRLQIERA